jgi:PAS domain S-box-containing protein
MGITMNSGYRKTLLLVEDEALIAMEEQRVLEEYGYRIITALSGEEAVGITASHPEIQLILMDINLGKGMDGTEAAREILKTRDIPVVFLSSHTEPEVVGKTEKITSYGYVVKNSGITILDASIKMAFKLFEAKIREQESKELYRGTINAMKDYIHVMDQDLRLVLFNDAFKDRTTELAIHADPIGKNLFEIFPFLPDEARDEYRYVFESNEVLISEENIQIQSRRIWTETHKIPILDKSGRAYRVITIIRDITERKQSDDKLQQYLNITKVMIIAINNNGKVTLSNRKASEILGYKQEEIQGKNWFDNFIPVDSRDEVKSVFFKVMSGELEPVEYYENPIVTSNGNERIIAWHNTYLKDDGGNIAGTLSSGEDITERKHLEAIQAAYHRVIEFAGSHTMEQLLQCFLDEAEALTNSKIGLCRFFGEDQELTSLQAWSTRTKEKTWIADNFNLHYSIHERRPVIHNDLSTLPEKGGLPKGQAPLVRELVLPIFRGEKIKAVLGVGNKSTLYTQDDAKTLKQLADLVWETISRKQAEEDLRRSEEVFRLIAENSAEDIWQLDRNGRVIYSSPAVKEVFGYTHNEVMGLDFNAFFPESEIPRAADAFALALSGKNYQLLEGIGKKKDGSSMPIEVSITPINRGGSIIGVQGIVRDISDRKRMESALRESEELFRTVFEQAAVGVAQVLPNGCFAKVNSRFCEITGYTEKEILRLTFREITCPEDLQNDDKRLNQVLSDEINSFGVEKRYIHKDGHFIWVKLYTNIVRDKKRNFKYAISVIVDISERKHTESALKNSNSLRETLLDNLQVGVFMTAVPIGSPLLVNKRAEELLGRGISEADSNNLAEVYKAYQETTNELYPTADMPIVRAIKGEETHIDDMYILRPDGSRTFLEVYGTPVRDENNRITAGLASFADITGRKKSENEIKSLLHDKEVLLKEVHHRIKNNITTIESLLSMQADSITNPEAITALQDAISRVTSMRVLYDKLLISEEYRDLPVKDYLEDLIDCILPPTETAHISVEKRIAEFSLPSKQLFTIGIILNELLTNITKYAFVNRDTGTVKISCLKSGNHITFSIQDNGIGLPDGFDIDKTDGFGFMLVRILCQQLQGSIAIENKNGALITLEFDI